MYKGCGEERPLDHQSTSWLIWGNQQSGDVDMDSYTLESPPTESHKCSGPNIRPRSIFSHQFPKTHDNCLGISARACLPRHASALLPAALVRLEADGAWGNGVAGSPKAILPAGLVLETDYQGAFYRMANMQTSGTRARRWYPGRWACLVPCWPCRLSWFWQGQVYRSRCSVVSCSG
jgi:hypothetical protein